MIMKHTMIMFVAERFKNTFMRDADLRPDYKWFYEERKAEFDVREGVEVNKAFFMKIIEKSYEGYINGNEPYWIPAIVHPQVSERKEKGCIVQTTNNTFYHHPSVKELSDGQHGFFVQNIV
jgi:hypothetical protein